MNNKKLIGMQSGQSQSVGCSERMAAECQALIDFVAKASSVTNTFKGNAKAYISFLKEHGFEPRHRQGNSDEIFLCRFYHSFSSKVRRSDMSRIDELFREKKIILDRLNALKDSLWQSQFEALVAFRKKHPDVWPGPNDGNLYLWCREQGKAHGRSETRREALRSVGFCDLLLGDGNSPKDKERLQESQDEREKRPAESDPEGMPPKKAPYRRADMYCEFSVWDQAFGACQSMTTSPFNEAPDRQPTGVYLPANSHSDAPSSIEPEHRGQSEAPMRSATVRTLRDVLSGEARLVSGESPLQSVLPARPDSDILLTMRYQDIISDQRISGIVQTYSHSTQEYLECCVIRNPVFWHNVADNLHRQIKIALKTIEEETGDVATNHMTVIDMLYRLSVRLSSMV